MPVDDFVPLAAPAITPAFNAPEWELAPDLLPNLRARNTLDPALSDRQLKAALKKGMAKAAAAFAIAKPEGAEAFRYTQEYESPIGFTVGEKEKAPDDPRTDPDFILLAATRLHIFVRVEYDADKHKPKLILTDAEPTQEPTGGLSVAKADAPKLSPLSLSPAQAAFLHDQIYGQSPKERFNSKRKAAAPKVARNRKRSLAPTLELTPPPDGAL